MQQIEAYSYGAACYLFSTYCSVLDDEDEDGSIASHPQGPFEGRDLTLDLTHRSPDFVILRSYYQHLFPTSPSYRQPFLGFWVEVKPLAGVEDWYTDTSQTAAGLEVEVHITQVCKQAFFAFQHHSGDTYYVFLVIGSYFTLLRFKRPAECLHPPSSNEEVRENSTYTGRPSDDMFSEGSSLSSAFVPPRTPPRNARSSKKRKLAAFGEEMELISTAETLGSTRSSTAPSGSKNSGPRLSKKKSRQRAPIPSAEAVRLKPDSIIYFNECIFTTNEENLNPHLLNALHMATSHLNISYQPSLFTPPVSESQVPLLTRDIATAAIESAFARAPVMDATSPEPTPYMPPRRSRKTSAASSSTRAPRTRSRVRSASEESHLSNHQTQESEDYGVPLDEADDSGSAPFTHSPVGSLASFIPSDIEAVPSSSSELPSDVDSAPSEPNNEDEEAPIFATPRRINRFTYGKKGRSAKGKGRAT